MKIHNYAIIMAGGVGSQSWPASKQCCPKQFQDILGSGKTLIQNTFDRLKSFIPAENILVLTNTIYKEIVMEQLPEISDSQVVLEPIMRNTAPAILLAAMKIHNRDPEARMLVAPSDHWIQEESLFEQDMCMAFEEAEKGKRLITFGIKPHFPNTRYGYIQYDDKGNEQIYHVQRFTEKPDFQTAQNFMNQGNYLWNSGIFVWKAQTILNKFEILLPDMFRLFKVGEGFYNKPHETNFLRSHYQYAENISVEYAIIEHSEEVMVIPSSFSWNDLGAWGSSENEFRGYGKSKTVVNTKFIPVEASGKIIRTEGNKMVLVDGLQDYMILENDEVLLIVPKEKEQRHKHIRNEVIERYGVQFI